MAPTSIRIPPPANRSRNWQELPVELTALILKRLSTIDLVLSARKVCHTWRQICSDPNLYRVVDLWFRGDPCKVNFNVVDYVARRAVALSRGEMIKFSISYFGDDHLLNYISKRSSQLRCLNLASCNITPEGLSEMVRTLPLLDELHLHCICITKQAIQDIGCCCPQLKTFRLNYQGKRELYFPYDKNAKAIAKSMPGLCHLQLFGNRITRNGLLAIIDNCSHLESLDIRRCFGCTKLGPDLIRRLYQQMSHLWLPDDSTKGCGLLDIYESESLSNDDLPGQFYDDLVSEDYDYRNDDYDYNENSNGSDTYDYHNDDHDYNISNFTLTSQLKPLKNSMAPTPVRVPPPANRTRNWQELPVKLTALILKRLSTVDLVLSARKVCHTWRHICSDPNLYRVVDLWFTGDPCKVNFNVDYVAHRAVAFSRGEMIEFSISYFGDDHLLSYISKRSSQLRCLNLASCNITPEGLSEMVRTLPLLDELHLHGICITKQAIQAIGRCCPQLKTFRLNYLGKRELYFPYDENAEAIAKSMPGLCHLQLFGNRITRNGLLAIIDNCSHLESLDIRRCFGCTKLGPDLIRRLYQKMSHLWLPYDSTKGCGLLDIYESEDCVYRNDDYDYNENSDGSDTYDYHNDDYDYNENSNGSDTYDYHNDDYDYNKNSNGSDTYDYHNDDYDYNESGGSEAGSY